MSVKEFMKACYFAPVFATVEALFLMHECIRMLRDLVANSRIFHQEILQVIVLFNELFVVDQRRVFLQLFGGLRMAVEKLVELGYVSPVVVSSITVAISEVAIAI